MLGKEYKAKVFKSGNSLALRLPKELGLKEGSTMVLREDRGKFAFEPAPPEERKIDLTIEPLAKCTPNCPSSAQISTA